MGQRGQDYVLSGIVELDDAYFGAPKSNGAVQTSLNIRQWMKASSSYGCLREPLSTSP